ncbi:MAG: tRNA dihydrouridine(20/20a) synthase DusA [Gammaproteobacteria bacterium]|nr:tRNA dihydrouridine(20/20a) synthase DusA [Gammaproteobacteria bacterium]
MIPAHTVSVAPMMDWTDRHCRYFYRLLSSRVQLYTEMITAKAILNGDKNRLLDYSASEHPLVLQLGGSDATEMAECADIAQKWGYDTVNINVGCPSERVLSGSFGACLMKEPGLVGACVEKMTEACNIPVTVKCRIGVDKMESYAQLSDFIKRVADSGCEQFVVHARKAWLQGLSPKENRTIPPLNYPWVYRLKKDFPTLTICINGGVQNSSEIKDHLRQTDGVMLGRAAYQQPYLLAEIDQQFYGESESIKNREEVLIKYMHYIQDESEKGVPIRSMTRHILGLYHGEKNAKLFRRLLSGKTVELSHLNEWLNIVKNY